MIGTKNRTFSSMAEVVDQKLQAVRDAQQDVQDAEQMLGKRRLQLNEVLTELDKARDELFEAHPELMQNHQPAPAGGVRVDQGGFEPIDVDDPDAPPEPIEFREV